MLLRIFTVFMNYSKNILIIDYLIIPVLVYLVSKELRLAITDWIMKFMIDINRAVAIMKPELTAQEFNQSLHRYTGSARLSLPSPWYWTFLTSKDNCLN